MLTAKKSVTFYVRRLLCYFGGALLLLVLSIIILFFCVTGPPEQPAVSPTEINDVTGLNPVNVGGILRPQTVPEIISAVKSNAGAVSVGGARHSMGGQIGTAGSLHLDMRAFDEVVAFDENKKEITVQTGITWRKIQEYIDPYNLSVMIMQTYADFTVGGSLSVNVHGRYIGYGPLIHSVRSIQVVLADGSLVKASREENAALFKGCIGGYGGLGVIVEATLSLTENVKVERQSFVLKASGYHDFFMKSIRSDSAIVFHNGDLYTGKYNEVRAVSYVATEKPVTIDDRLRPLNKNYRVDRFAIWVLSEAPFGKWMRQNWVDPLIYKSGLVEWRNYEASYDAMELEPTSRKKTTYVLQEYFIPTEHFDAFVPRMAAVFTEHNVNVINVSIRHARPDTTSLLSWARQEVFCFVIYYKQGTTQKERTAVGTWTRKLIDAALAEGGTYYLPYQIHATHKQFHEAYPRATEFFALKKKVDPSYKFRNKLWDEYVTIVE